MSLLENTTSITASLLKIEYDNHQIDTNTRNKKLYFGDRYNGQYIENSFFKKSVII